MNTLFTFHFSGNAATGGEPSELAKEKITQYFRVEDKFDFDNAAFTKTVDSGIKFLCCVDCR